MLLAAEFETVDASQHRVMTCAVLLREILPSDSCAITPSAAGESRFAVRQALENRSNRIIDRVWSICGEAHRGGRPRRRASLCPLCPSRLRALPVYLVDEHFYPIGQPSDCSDVPIFERLTDNRRHYGIRTRTKTIRLGSQHASASSLCASGTGADAATSRRRHRPFQRRWGRPSGLRVCHSRQDTATPTSADGVSGQGVQRRARARRNLSSTCAYGASRVSRLLFGVRSLCWTVSVRSRAGIDRKCRRS